MSSLLPDSRRDPDAPPRVLVEALREEAIDPAHIERAYARFLRQRASAPTWWRGPRIARHATVGVLMAVGTVYAAIVMQPASGRLELTQARPPPEAPRLPGRKVSPPRPAIVVEQDVSVKPEPTPEAEKPAAAPPASVRAQPVRNPTAVPSAEHWKRAAQGLRDGDYRRADAALKELTRTGTESDRESALLVQAQVLLAQGREREAQTVLKSLEGSARSPSVRRKSAELLARLRDRPAARSGKARGVNEGP